MKKTKVVCTIGPSSDSPEVLDRMLQAGMNVARFNFSHGSHEEHLKRIEAVRAASKRTGIPVALMMDTKGPEIRLGLFKDKKVLLEEGKTFVLTTEAIEGTAERAQVSHAGLPQDVKVGSQILLSDGLVNLHVEKIEGTEIYTKILNTGVMSDRKRVAVPGAVLSLPAVSDADEEDLRFGAQQGLDYVAASFMQRGEDVVEIRRIIEEEGSSMQIIAKIENGAGMDNIDDILLMADGLMVARGDLGVEIPAEEVPVQQKLMIEKANRLYKPVITATQMLESMVQNPRPTRAETSDVANAIFDGTDAIMLSGETASGSYPVEAVETMRQIALVTEASELYRKGPKGDCLEQGVSDAISKATVDIADTLNAAAIITATESGRTALAVSKSHPTCQVIAVTPHDSTIRRCQLYWGVIAVKGSGTMNSDELVNASIQEALAANLIQSGDLAVLTAGVPSGKAGQTNMIRVHVAGRVLLAANGGIGKELVTGKVCVAKTAEELKTRFEDGDILVVPSAEQEFVPYIKRASALIAEEGGFSSSAAIIGLNLGLPVLFGANEATNKLEHGAIVTLDASTAHVVENVVK